MSYIGNTNTTQAFTPAIDYFSGNASTTAFTLSKPVASVAQVQVVVNNVAQNPSSAYTVSSNTITFTSAPSSGTNNIYVYYTSPITQVIAPGQNTVYPSSLSYTNALYWDTSGNVGIGTTSPQGKLQVYASASDNLIVTGHVNATDGPALKAMDSTAANYKALEVLSAELRVGGTNGILFGTSGTGGSTERMRIDSSGNVGIGTTSVGGKLTIAGAAAGVAGYFTDSVNSSLAIATLSGGVTLGTDPGGQIHLATDGATAAKRRLSIDASGNTTMTGTLTTSAKGIARASLPAGSIVQVATFQTGEVATGTGTIPIDNTIPQITEGTEFMTLAITPTTTTSKLVINVCIQLDKNNGNTLTVALFQDSTANAIASQFYGALGSGISMPLTFTHSMTSGTTSSTTFRVRAGSEAAGTVTRNGRGGGRIDGGVAVSSITIYEVAV